MVSLRTLANLHQGAPSKEHQARRRTSCASVPRESTQLKVDLVLGRQSSIGSRCSKCCCTPDCTGRVRRGGGSCMVWCVGMQGAGSRLRWEWAQKLSCGGWLLHQRRCGSSYGCGWGCGSCPLSLGHSRSPGWWRWLNRGSVTIAEVDPRQTMLSQGTSTDGGEGGRATPLRSSLGRAPACMQWSCLRASPWRRIRLRPWGCRGTRGQPAGTTPPARRRRRWRR
jgi:hypothetical protein